MTKTKHWNGSENFLFTAKFTPVTSGSEENKRFYEATPSGTLELSQFKEDLFEPGKDYYLTIEKAE